MSEFFNTRLGEAVEFIKNGTTATQLKIKCYVSFKATVIKKENSEEMNCLGIG